MDADAHVNAQEWWESLCRRPQQFRHADGTPYVALCLRPQGHDGECLHALAEQEEPDDRT